MIQSSSLLQDIYKSHAQYKNIYHMQPQTEKVLAQAYKLFYLEDDHTNSVFEKVFICNYEVLKKIRYQLKEKIKIFGLIGPVEQIYRHLALYYTQFHIKQQGESNKKISIEFTNNQKVVDLREFSKKFKAAVYLLKFQNNGKQDSETIFLALVSNDKLYYQKPFDQRSLAYLLLRFIGDLCNDVVILYDKKIWNSLTSTDCPYSAGNNRFFQMNIRQKQRQHIQIKQIDCEKHIPGYQMSNIIDWSHNLFKSQDSYLQYFTKVDETQLQNRGTQSKKKILQLVFEKTIENGVFEVQKNVKQTEQLSTAINELKNMHFKTKQSISRLMNQCIKFIEKQSIQVPEKGQRIQQLINKKFQQIYYWFMLSQESRPILGNNQIIVLHNAKIMNFIEKKSFEFLQEMYPNQLKEITEVTRKSIHQKISQYLKDSKDLFSNDIFKNFFSVSQILLDYQENVYFKVEKIQIVKFDFIKHKQNNMVNKLEFKKSGQITLPLNFLKKYLSSISLEKIKDIKLFKAKFIKQYNIVLVTRETGDAKMFEYNLLSFDHHQIRSLIKYKDKQLVFHFDEISKKVYIMKTISKELTIFNFDDFQKPKNELNILLDKVQSNFDIVSYAVSKTPNQKFYFLDSRKDRLYCYDITESRYKKFQETQSSKIQKHQYDYIRAFNNNLYIILGNRQIVNVFEVHTNNYFLTIKQIKCKSNQITGVSTHADEKHEYLVVYEKDNFKAYLFQNMNCQNLIRQTEKKIMQGNPILDIFYQAKDRFGFYKTYTLKKNLPETKQLSLHHVNDIFEEEKQKEKVKDYLKKLILQRHTNQYYTFKHIRELYSSHGLQTNIIHFINEAQSRIPVQICSIQNGNIIPLKDGNIINNFDGQQAPIQERCKVLNFGIVQRLLRQDKDKKTIVIAVMGPQSTGKSYLLNRLFGTRFTVASCRTTIGIWMSLIRGQSLNFVLLDCEGLFSIHRQLNEQEKLIKILTSISDFTILNLNKSMTSNNLIQLMSNLSKSVSKNTLKSQQLYQGKLFIVVRDVAPNEPRGLLDQLYDNLENKIQIQEFLINLFNNGSKQTDRPFFIQLLPTFTQTASFNEDVQELKKIMIEQSLKKGTKSSEMILEWLKIIINQLACDDSRIPSQVMLNRKLEVIEEKAKLYWEKGSQKNSFSDEIFTISVTIKDNDIEIEQNRGTKNIFFDKMHEIFKAKVLSIKPINSVAFATAYKSLNQYIKRFCNARLEYTKSKLEQQQKSLSEQNIENELGEIKQKIRQTLNKIQKQKQQLSYCLKKCSSPECEQPCIKVKNHSAKIEQKISSLKSAKSLAVNCISNNALTEEQINEKKFGIEELVKNESLEVQDYKKMEQNFIKIEKHKKEIEQAGRRIKDLEENMSQEQKSIRNNKRKLLEYKSIVILLENILHTYIKQKGNQSTEPEERNMQIVKQEKYRLERGERGQFDQISYDECERIKEISQEMKGQKDKINEIRVELATKSKQKSKTEEDNIALLQKIQIQIYDCKSKIQQNSKQIYQSNHKLTNITLSIQNNQRIVKDCQSEKQKLDKQIDDESIKLDKKNSIINQILNKREAIKEEIKQISDNQSSSSGELIPKIIEFHQKRNSQIYNLFKSYLIIQEHVNQCLTKYKCDDISQLQKKIKFELNKKSNKEKLQAMERLREQLYLIKEAKQIKLEISSEIQTHNQSVDKFCRKLCLDLYKDGPSENDPQQKRVIELMCKTKISIKQNIYPIHDESDIFQGLLHIRTKDMASKILSVLDEQESSILKKQLSLQEFVKYLEGKSEADPSQRKSKNEKEYIIIQQQMGNNLEDETSMQKLSQRISFIDSLIKLDNSLIKAITCYKSNIIYCFEKYLIVLVKYKKINEQTAIQCIEELVSKLKDRNKELTIQVEKGKLIKISGEYCDSVEVIKKDFNQILSRVQKQILREQKIIKQDLFADYPLIQKIIKHENTQKCLKKLLEIQMSQCFDQTDSMNKFVAAFLVSFDSYLQKRQHDDDSGYVRVLLEEYFKICKTHDKVQKQLEEKNAQEKQLKQKQDQIQKDYDQQKYEKQKLQTQILNKKKERQNCIEQQQIARKSVENQKTRKRQICGRVQQLQAENQDNIKKLSAYEQKLDDLKKYIQVEKENKQEIQKMTAFYSQYYENLSQFYSKNISTITDEFQKEKLQTKLYYDQLGKLRIKLKEQINKSREQEENISNLLKVVQNYEKQTLTKMIKEKEAKIERLEELRKKVILLETNQIKLKEIQKQLQTLTKSQETKCSCQTNHKCDMKCEIGCVDKQCLQRGGHEGKHACNSHQCDRKCEVDEQCQFVCQKVLGHVDSTHDCKNNHLCLETCKHCERQCSSSKFQIHQIHLCDIKKCPKKCILCQRPCASIDHNHDDLAQMVTLFKPNNETSKNQQIRRKLHLCSGQHNCQSLCIHPGICKNSYQNKTKPWQKKGVLIEYEYIEQIEIKNSCTLKIPAGQYKHAQDCKCGVNHSCTYRCPDCRSLCYRPYKHSQSIHETNHRNQQSLIYASENKGQEIRVLQKNQHNNKEQFIFNVGEESTPFKCDQSCERKGRGHYHLIQCPGGQNCYEKKLQKGARHSQKVYEPYRDKKYDMVLCAIYWSIHEFQAPSAKQELRLCNFACMLVDDHRNKLITYCKNQAWHSNSPDRRNHDFECDKYHKKLLINAVQICFLIDVTGSFNSYIAQCVKTIKTVIERSSKDSSMDKTNTKFSVVGYRDHKMAESNLFKQLKRLCIDKKQQLALEPLTEDKALQMSESVFEDTLLNLQKKYNSLKNQVDYLQKFEESEKFILKYHYPFYIDVKSSRKLLDEKRRPGTVHYNIMRNESPTKKKSLKEHLAKELDYYINLIENQSRQEAFNYDKNQLVQIQDFTTPQKCIEFLTKLKAEGGGDPPQAVLDGMNAAAKLNWSSGDNTSRHILHLFDSPPHGEQFDTNNEDYYPHGCPCKLNLNDIIGKIMKSNINYKIYPFTSRINKTLEIFKKIGLKFEIEKVNKLEEFTESATDFICSEIAQNEVMVNK